MHLVWTKIAPTCLLLACVAAAAAGAATAADMKNDDRMRANYHRMHDRMKTGAMKNDGTTTDNKMMDHRQHHRAMMRMHGHMGGNMMGGNMDHAAMMKMHAMHHGRFMKAAMPMHRPMQMAMAGSAKTSGGSCGTYMYRKAGTCMDARVKK